MDQLTIVIPAYNEAQSIEKVVAAILDECGSILTELIVVDDGSADDTGALAEQAGARVIRHKQNRGYGASLKTGIKAASTDWVMTADADGQHRTEDIVSLWQARADHDMIVGQRMSLLHSPLWRMPGKWLLGRMANYIARRKIPDLNSGLRLMRYDIVTRYMHLCPSGFSFSTTITMALLSRGYDVDYVPIEVRKREGTSTVSFRTGLDAIKLLIRIAALFDPLRVFIPAAMILGSIGVLWGIPYALLGRGISVGAMLAIVTAVVLFALGVICDQVSQLRLERYE